MRISNHENHCTVLQIIDVTNKNCTYKIAVAKFALSYTIINSIKT